MDDQARRGAADALTDVAGLRVGHAERTGDGWLSGVTVVLAPDGGAVTAVDVRGGGPGTRETDALDPRNLVPGVEAVVLTGGSAYGLDAASGVVAWLEEQGRGFRVGVPGQVVPVVPAAALFDLGRGGDWGARPGPALGREAVEAAAASAEGAPVAQGCVGAGTGAVAGGLKGGVGTASTVLPSGITVAALVAVNAAGSVVDPDNGALWAGPGTSGGPGRGQAQVGGPGSVRAQAGGPVSPEVLQRARQWLAAAAAATADRRPRPPATTLAVVATDAVLTRAQAHKLAGSSHDGLARAVRPAHLLSDGDTVFAMATGRRPLVPRDRAAAADPAFGVHIEAGSLDEVLAAGADALTRAIRHAVLAAETVDGPGGVFPSYRDLYQDLYQDR
nr:P1 family peptidase [Streptomyces sp. NBC_00899]